MTLEQTQPVMKYVMSLEKVQKIALNGMTRASYFTRFAASTPADFKTYTAFTCPEQIIQMGAKPLAAAHFDDWHKAYMDWVFCNAVNEVVEKFYTFLEFVVVLFEMEGQHIPFKRGDDVLNIMKAHQEAIRSEYKYYRDVREYLTSKGVALPEDEDKIVWSFADIRNLLTHNGGVVEHRRNLEKDDSQNIVLSWYYAEVFAIGEESGKEYALAEMPLKEAGYINMRPKGIKTKTFQPGTQISFTYHEVQEICWTFYLIVIALTRQIKEGLQKKSAA